MNRKHINKFLVGLFAGFMSVQLGRWVIYSLPSKPVSQQVYVPQKQVQKKSPLKVYNTFTSLKTKGECESIPLEPQFQYLIKMLALDMKLSEELIYGVIDLESDFSPTCESYTGAQGLMQIDPSTYKWMLKDMKTNKSKWYNYASQGSLWCNQTNIIIGVYHIKYLLEHAPKGLGQEEQVHYALTAYNRGEGGANSFIKKYGSYSSVYSREVLKRQIKYKQLLT